MITEIELKEGLCTAAIGVGFSRAVAQCIQVSAADDNRYRVVVCWLAAADAQEVDGGEAHELEGWIAYRLRNIAHGNEYFIVDQISGEPITRYEEPQNDPGLRITNRGASNKTE